MTQKTEFILSARDDTQAAFNSVNGALSKITGSSVNLIESFKGIGLAAVGLAGIGSLAAFKGQIDTAIHGLADLKDASEKTGASVENLSALKGIAKIGDRDFSAIEGAIGKLNKALHGTDDESKGAGKALAALGLSLNALRDMDPAQAFIEIAKAQEKFADGGGKSAALMAIMGKTAAEQIPYMHDLADAQHLIGKATTQQAKDADDYEKNVKRLQASWGTLSRQMGAAAAGPLKDITDWMVQAQKEGGVLAGVFTGIGMAMAKAVGIEINPFKRAESQASEAFAKIATLKQGVAATQGAIDAGEGGLLGSFVNKQKLAIFKADLASAEKDLKSSTARLKKIAASEVEKDKPKDTSLNSQTFGAAAKGDKGSSENKSDPATDLIARLDKQISVRALDLTTTEKLTAAEKEAAEIKQQLDAGTIKATASQRLLIDGKLEFLVAADKEIQSQTAYATALEGAETAMTGQRQKMIESIAAAENLAEVYGLTESQLSVVTQSRLDDAIAIAKANGASEESIKYLEEELRLRGLLTDALIKVDQKRIDQQATATGEMDEFAKSAARNLQSSLSDFLFDPFAKGTENMATKFGQLLQRMAAEAAAAQIMKGLFGDMGSAGKGSSGGGDWGWVGQAATFVGSFFAEGGVMTSTGSLPLKKYAKGGIANSPQVSVWGEGKTPEAMVPLADGRTIPVTLKGGQGGTTINQTIYAGQGTDAAQVRRSAAAGARSALGAITGAQRYA